MEIITQSLIRHRVVDMSNIYEIYYENKQGDIVHCQDTYDEQEAFREIHNSVSKFPENSYWYKVTHEDEQ